MHFRFQIPDFRFQIDEGIAGRRPAAGRAMKKISIVLLVLAALSSWPRVDAAGLGTGPIEADVKSEYSHILIRRQGSLRSMNFVRDNGVEQIQTALEHEAALRTGDAIQPPDVRQLLLHARSRSRC